jgi:hypothetical protein
MAALRTTFPHFESHERELRQLSLLLEWECSRSLRQAIPTEEAVRVYNCENFEEGGCS